MKFIKFYVSLLLFIFVVVLFPSYYDAIRNANFGSSNVAPFLQASPFILVALFIIFPIYFYFEEK